MNHTADSVRDPANWPGIFTDRLDAGDLAGILALYEPDAKMLAPPHGQPVAGHENIRSVVAGLIKSQARLASHVVNCVTIGDIAILYTDFRGSRTDATGNRQDIQQRAIEVLRRQPDGSWQLIFGDPLGRGSGPDSSIMS